MSITTAGATYPLLGKLALITGCTGGIGQATARLFAQNGCSIAVHHSSAHSKAKADALVAELVKLAPGVKAAAFQADLSTYEAARRLHDEVVNVLGHPDILFVNHGVTGPRIGPQGDIQDVSPEVFEEIWRTNNGTGYIVCPNADSKGLRELITMSSSVRPIHPTDTSCTIHSVAAGTGGVIGPQYASSKSAMHGLIHWLSQRYCKEGILTNGVAPALIEGEYMMKNPPDAVRNLIPIGRLGKPDEIASIVLMLAINAYMTNKVSSTEHTLQRRCNIHLLVDCHPQILVADGGYTNGGGF
ncbi:NAD-P-binding protein [Trametes versicolor FP-101664 SS1]|uniref:NAD-P-binding protein n=1 Tax=Trametes versicolor (strain FP-101664) TaxID=717944 RepID=UPI00046233AC|nr:NAD-P-binding protein [Trametes versicolor FP-101664 SS1]EIW61058.1 NAD-P-binding protein [Trametes versicolor FP-101664 SS1]